MSRTEDSVDDFLRKYQDAIDRGVPEELGLDVGVCNVPNVGKTLFCSFVWASKDLVAGQRELDNVKRLGTVSMAMVSEVTPSEWLRAQSDNMPPYGVYASAGPTNIMVPFIDKQLRSILEKYTTNLPPNPATLWVEHHPHGAALRSTLNSCFGYRQPHFMVEIVGSSAFENASEESGQWATSFHADARSLSGVLQGGYVVLNSPQVPQKLCYGVHWEALEKLKMEHDPQNVFRFTVTGLGEMSR